MGLWALLTGRAALTPPPQAMQVASPWSPTDQLTRITLNDLFPSYDPDCWPIGRAEAMTVPAVAAARHRVVGTLFRLPLKPYTSTGALWAGPGGLLEQPDDGEPHTTTMRDTLEDIFFDGVAWWLVVSAYATADQSQRTRPASIVRVPVGDVDADADGVPSVSDGFLDWLVRVRRISPLEDPSRPGVPWLIRFDGPHAGICSFGGRAVRSAVNLDRAAQHATDNPVPSIELHQTTDADMEDTDVDDLIRSWRDARRRGGIGYTNSAIELKTHGQQPEQLLIDGRNQQAVEIARLAGIPAASIDAGIPGTSLTYANLVDRLQDLIQFGLSPYASSITARLSMDDCLPRGIRARFDYSELYPAPVAASTTPTAAPAPLNQGATT